MHVIFIKKKRHLEIKYLLMIIDVIPTEYINKITQQRTST